MTMLSSSYGIIIDCANNAPFHRKDVVDGLNATYKRYLKEQIEMIGKLASNNTSNIGMLPSASKHVYIKFSDQCIQILYNKEGGNELKCSTRIQKREPLFKYQSRVYNIHRESDVNHIGIKMRCRDKLSLSLNVNNDKTSTYGIKGILRHYEYRSYHKLSPGIVAVIIISYS